MRGRIGKFPARDLLSPILFLIWDILVGFIADKKCMDLLYNY